MKIHKTIIFFCSFLFLFSCSKNQTKIEFLTQDIQLNENLSGKNLNGHTVIIAKNGLELSNVFNGNITVLEKTGAGTVTIKNSSIDTLTVESKSTIILDSTTSIKKLIIRDNAKITSTKTLEKKYSKKKEKNPENYENQQPVIETVEINYGLTPLFEGGKFENIVKLQKQETTPKPVEEQKTPEKTAKPAKSEAPKKTDKPAEIVISKQSEAIIQKIENSGTEKKLTLIQDESYTGDGVKIDIINRPENAGFMQIYKITSNNYSNQIAWYNENAFWEPEQISRYLSDSFTYEYLNAGEKYTFIVNYLSENKANNTCNIVESSKISVVPKSGSELSLANKDWSMSVNPETGIAKWNKIPDFNIKPGAFLQYSLNWGNWKYFGHIRRSATATDAFNQFNIYKNLNHLDLSLFENENVFIQVIYEYNGFTWEIYQSEYFDYDISKVKQK